MNVTIHKRLSLVEEGSEIKTDISVSLDADPAYETGLTIDQLSVKAVALYEKIREIKVE